MTDYMLISSRDPFECGDTHNFYRLAVELRERGREVTLFLVQNGVLSARDGADNPAIRCVVEAGVRVLADKFSLRERAINKGSLLDGVSEAHLDRIIDAMATGAKTIWH